MPNALRLTCEAARLTPAGQGTMCGLDRSKRLLDRTEAMSLGLGSASVEPFRVTIQQREGPRLLTDEQF